MRAAVFAFMLLCVQTCVAGELQFTAAGGDHLTVKAVAEQQQWVVRGDETLVAAVVDGRLIVESFAWPPGPGPNPDPGPGPEPEPQPQPGPGPKRVIWIEETSDRDIGDAASITDADVRKALAAAGWSIRVADVDVTDENGNPPADLAPYIEIARERGLPYMLILDKNGVEVYSGKAPDGVDQLKAILKRFGLPVSGSGQADGRGKDARPEADASPKRVLVVKEPEKDQPRASSDCPTGTCPTQPAPTYTRRRGLFR